MTRLSERGWTLPIVIFAITLLAFLSRGITGLAILLGSLSNDMRHGAASHEAVRREVAPFMNSRPGCASLMIGDLGSKQEWASCREDNTPFTTVPTIAEIITHFNYDQIFTAKTQCPGTQSVVAATSLGAPVSSTVCLVREQIRDDLIVSDNLNIATPIELPPSQRQLSTIATPGYLLAQHGIYSSNDLLILAGGDIEIALIGNRISEAIRVTIISAHGESLVSKTSGRVSLLLIGRSSLRAPPTPWLPPFPLPLRRSPSILGITPG